MGTVNVWDGAAWQEVAAFGAGGGTPPDDPAELLQRFTFEGGDLTGWTNGSADWSEAPTDWITASGNGSGTTFLRRLMPEGTVYVEADLYEDGTGENWACVRIFDVEGAIYDNGAYGALVRGNGNLASPWSSGAAEGGHAGDLTGPDVPSPDQAHMITLALWVGTGGAVGTTELYVDGVLRERYTGQSDLTANDFLTIGVYNGASAHFHEVRCYSGIPA